MSLPLALVIALVLLVQFSAWMVWRNVMIWKPVVAHMGMADYREFDERFDRTLGRLTASNENVTTAECWYKFKDHTGRIYEVQLTRFYTRGHLDRSATTLWYDPENPDRATLYGPAFWGFMVAVGLFGLGWVLMNGDRLSEFF